MGLSRKMLVALAGVVLLPFSPAYAEGEPPPPSIVSVTIAKYGDSTNSVVKNNDELTVVAVTQNANEVAIDASAFGVVNILYLSDPDGDGIFTTVNRVRISVSPGITAPATVSATARNTNDGTESTATESNALILDTAPPAAPIVTIPSSATISGKETFVIQGTAEAGAIVRASYASTFNLVPGAVHELAENVTEFSVTVPLAPLSANHFLLNAWDIAGNVSSTTVVPTITHEIDPPVAECCSSVMFLPGLEGSILADGANTLWPPTFGHVSEDLHQLFLNPDDTPVNPSVTVDGILNTFPVGPFSMSIYQGFSDFMDALAASTTLNMREWKPLPYDWRYSPERIIANGIQTPSGIVDLVQEIETLAANSYTGQVTLITHSYGGLVGKTLIKALMDKGEENLIDAFVMVASPQLGTPKAAAGLLHGEGSDIAWGPIVFVNKADPRALGQNMESAYDLLPSERYFADVIDPPIVFDSLTPLTALWREEWGFALNTFQQFFDFMTGSGPDRTHPAYADTQNPEVLRTDLMQNADAFHTTFDNFVSPTTFPADIRVVQIAGWGLPTIKGLEYVESHGVLDYRPRITTEGDETVVYSSAISSAGEKYFFNLFDYNETPAFDAQHRDILSTVPIQNVIKYVIEKQNIENIDFVGQTKPNIADIDRQLFVSVHSPMTIGAYGQGKFTGITPDQDPSADIQLVTTDIPGSSYFPFGEGKYLVLPKNGSYDFTLQGTAAGSATIEIGEFENDTATTTATYSDIPVTVSTSATFVMDTVTPQNTEIQVDTNGDGTVDAIISSDQTALTLDEFIAALKTKIQSLDIKPHLKKQLLKKVEKVEKKIAKQKSKQASKVITNLGKQVLKKGDKGKISDTDVAEIMDLLDKIENAL